MNRRSMLSAAVGACAALLLPWRKAKAENGEVMRMRDPKHLTEVSWGNFQLARIRRLLDKWGRDTKENKLLPKLREACKKHGGDPDRDLKVITYSSVSVLVQRMGKTDLIEIWLDEQTPDDEGLYGCGCVVMETTLAASMDDKKLLKHLIEAYCVAIMPPYVSRQGILEGFKGKPVVIKKGEVVGGYKCISGEPSVV